MTDLEKWKEFLAQYPLKINQNNSLTDKVLSFNECGDHTFIIRFDENGTFSDAYVDLLH